jgi:hypothetical protein
MVTAEMGSGNLWDQGSVLDDEAGAWDWLRVHLNLCTAVLAIILATLYGAHWAGQPSREMGTMSSSSVSVPASLPAVE